MDFLVLLIGNIFNGISHTEAGHQKSRAAADANYHHKKPLFIAKYISDRYLLQEIQTFPDNCLTLQKNSFSCLRRFGAHQARRYLL